MRTSRSWFDRPSPFDRSADRGGEHRSAYSAAVPHACQLVAGYADPVDGLSPVIRVQALLLAVLAIATSVQPSKIGKWVLQMAKTLQRVALPAALMTVVGSTALNAAPG